LGELWGGGNVLIQAVADTHTVIWYIFQDSRLSALARNTIEQAAADGHQIAVAAITFVEIVFLSERDRIPQDTLSRLLTALNDPTAVFVEVPLSRELMSAFQRVSRSEIPELSDRIISATALHLGVPVITRDHKIEASTIATIW
jgi:PIN domain nuclease of toxin-antitoxin system